MSYEGYTEYLCEDGHHWTQDAYDERPRMCADCGKRAVWYHDVDQTNGDDDWALLDAIETAAFAQCNYGHTHQVRVARYKIPTTIGSRLGETPMTDMNNCQIVSLSERIRPNSEAAPWVVEAVQKLEAENQRLKAERGVLTDEVTDWILVADGVKHDWRCFHGEANTPLCLRCQLDALKAKVEKQRKQLDEYESRMGSGAILRGDR